MTDEVLCQLKEITKRMVTYKAAGLRLNYFSQGTANQWVLSVSLDRDRSVHVSGATLEQAITELIKQLEEN